MMKVNRIRNNKKSHLIVALSCILALSSCKVSHQSINTQEQMTQDTASVVKHANEASIRMMQEVCHNNEDNVWLSPISVSMALKGVYDGSEGATQEELGQVVTDLKLKTNNILEIADAIWIQPEMSVKKSYLARCKQRGLEIYNERIEARKVNQWASKHTHGRIDKVVSDPLPKGLMLLIANAVYFKGDWQKPFERENTHRDWFYKGDGKAKEVEMMSQTGRMRYTKTEQIEIVSLPYQPSEDGRHYEMEVILPKQGIHVGDVIGSMTEDDWQKWMMGREVRRVELTMPKLTMSYERILNEDLMQMGVRRVFDGQAAELRGISDKGLCVSMVKQNSFLKIDEKGTEAAAVTTVMLRATAMPPQDEVVFVVNRPYLLAIREVESGAILFMGKIEDVEK